MHIVLVLNEYTYGEAFVELVEALPESIMRMALGGNLRISSGNTPLGPLYWMPYTLCWPRGTELPNAGIVFTMQANTEERLPGNTCVAWRPCMMLLTLATTP